MLVRSAHSAAAKVDFGACNPFKRDQQEPRGEKECAAPMALNPNIIYPNLQNTVKCRQVAAAYGACHQTKACHTLVMIGMGFEYHWIVYIYLYNTITLNIIK